MSDVVNPPSRARVRRWIIGLAVFAVLVVTAPVWGYTLLLLGNAALEGVLQRTTIEARQPGTMPLVAPGREASVIYRGGPCMMCASGTRGSVSWGAPGGATTQLYMIDREAYALLPREETPRRIQVVTLDPMVVLVRDDPSEGAPPEEGFAPSNAYQRIHGGQRRLWHGTTLPGPLAGLSWARPGVAPTPLMVIDGQRASIPLPSGRLDLTEAGGTITVTRH